MRETPRLAWFIAELAKRFRVIFIDRRGIGSSDGPADGAPVHLDHWVADCRAVLDAVASRAVIAFGHEHGGPVAIRLAAELPDRVKGLVLHSTAARPLRAPDHPYGPTDDAVERIDRMIDRMPGRTDMLTWVAPSAGNDNALRAWLDRAGRLGAGPARARELHRAYLHSDVRSVLPAVRAPTVVLYPARVLRGDPGRGRYLAEHLPDAELQLLDSGDHLFWLADADVTLAAIDRLASRLTPTVATTAPARLRAIVAVVPNVGGEILRAHGAETCVSLPHALAATFTSLAAAPAAVRSLKDSHPSSTIAVDVADTTGSESDVAIITAIGHAIKDP
jgi:pimeloyl-ACP methyl ester carboxylesterase